MKRRVSQVSVLVSGPQLLFAQSVAAVLRAQYGMNVLDVHPGSAAGVAAAASEFLPDVVVSEAWMSDLQGADAVAAIKRAVPESRIILLSGAHRPDQIRRAIAAGADGFLPKSIKVDVLAEGIHRAQGGESPVFGRELDNLVAMISFRRTKSQEALDRLGGLTKRERSVLSWLGTGAATDAIAEGLFISPTTVKNHIKHLLAKTGAGSREELVALARLAGMIRPPPTTQDFPIRGGSHLDPPK